jgi:hypothetical protein
MVGRTICNLQGPDLFTGYGFDDQISLELKPRHENTSHPSPPHGLHRPNHYPRNIRIQHYEKPLPKRQQNSLRLILTILPIPSILEP